MEQGSKDFTDQFTEETSTLLLDPKHPGIGDQNYCDRREWFFNLAREFRLGKKGVPRIDYNEDEHGVWKHVCKKLQELHQRKACSHYLRGIEVLQISRDRLPQLADLSEELNRITGFSIVPAEGLINFRDFFGYLANGQMLCTQYLRHHSQPEYTPEPDMVHDVIGHVPFLANQEYVDFIRLVGRASQLASEDQLSAFNRLYWFGIEFGLIEEQGEVKVFGAGLLSSIGEIEFCYSDKVERRPFDIFEVAEQDYDPTQMQKTLFVISSLADMQKQTEELIRKLGLDEAISAAG